MKRNNTFWWFVIVSIGFTLLSIAGIGFLFWRQLLPAERLLFTDFVQKNLGFIFGGAVLVLAGAGLAVDWVFRIYVLPIGKIADEAEVIFTVNSAHRIKNPDGSREISRLADIINRAADHFETQQRSIQREVEYAKQRVEEEKNILAQVIAELPTGVLICNADCRVLLYNRQVKQMLSEGRSDSTARPLLVHDRFIGLGRSIFSILDKNLVVHALDDIGAKIDEERRDMSSSFITPIPGGKLLLGQAIPVLDRDKLMVGLIFLFSDITGELESNRQLDAMLQKLTNHVRSSLSGIRSVVEAMIDYPDMDDRQRRQFEEIIHAESISLGRILTGTVDAYTSSLRDQWPRINIRMSDFLGILIRKIRKTCRIDISSRPVQEEIWIKVDTYSMVLALLYLVSKLKTCRKVSSLHCTAVRRDGFVALDFSFTGVRITKDELEQWEKENLVVPEDSLLLTLGEVLRQHRTAVWSYTDGESAGIAYLRLLIPISETQPAAESRRRVGPALVSRPEYYDFDLFEASCQTDAYDEFPLSGLTYTVMDTETTGLDPARDEIISVGAVRIVNGKLRREEVFDQLVDPGRSIPWESIRYHGIQPEMIRGQPGAAEVLPVFHRFCEGTVLVAHNAAFDMKMLKMKESATGVRFVNPVLDTLLLSALVHPAHKSHDLEAIARRLGIRVFGRHTALGDAIVTGEIFLRLIPILRQNGIETLGQARAASRKTYYARLKY